MAKSCARCGQRIIDKDVEYANHLRNDTHRERVYSGRGQMAVMRAAGYIPEAGALRYQWGPSFSPPDLHMQCGCCCKDPYPVEPEVAAMVSGFMRSAGFVARTGQASCPDGQQDDGSGNCVPIPGSSPASCPDGQQDDGSGNCVPIPPANEGSGSGSGSGLTLPSIPGLPTDPSMIPSDPAQITALAQQLLGSGFPSSMVSTAVQMLLTQAQSGGDPNQIANAQALLSAVQSGGGSGGGTPPTNEGSGTPSGGSTPMTMMANRPAINTSIFQFAPGVVTTPKNPHQQNQQQSQQNPTKTTPATATTSKTPVILGAVGSGALLLLGATALWAVVPIAAGIAYMEYKSKTASIPAPAKNTPAPKK